MDSQQPAVSFGSGAQIRSRITVVCAECKRLKLKCDRRAPCGSCVKRDTVSRCAYSAAAAEKIDVQSLHNRVLLLEAQIQSLSGGRLRIASNTGLDRALVVSSGGSSIIANLEDIASVWLEQLDLVKDMNFRPAQEHHSPGFFDAHAFPDMSLFRPNDGGELPCVTPVLLELLPPENMRDILLAEFENIMLLRPSFNFPHFRLRVNAIFNPGHKAERPSLTYFACATLGFALGAQSWLESNKSGAVTTPRSYDPDALYTLADHALQIYERIDVVYDVDYITALILQVLFLIHDGKPRVNPRVFAIVGKMVTAARSMGLSVDPDDTPGKYSPFDSEMRRRAWWDVYFYDLFISDFLGHVPTIADNTFTTNMPAECDDDQLTPHSGSIPAPSDLSTQTNNSYFIQKCRLAQLVKNMKKRVFQDPKQPALEPSLEVAQACEGDIVTWLGELPPVFKVQAEVDPAHPPPAYLLAQRCELAMIANSLILKVYLPFIKKSSPRANEAVLYSSVNAAHKIVHSADQLQQHMKGPRHSLAFMSYFFNMQLFHAAVVCANTSIQEPTSIHAKPCMKDLHDAIRIMRDPFVPTSRGPMVGGVEGSKSEPLRILDMLQKKAEDAARGSMFAAGTKRKHSEVEDHIQGGFHIPYAGPGIITSPANSMSPPPPPAASSSTSQSSTSRSRTATSERPIQPAAAAPPAAAGAWPADPSTSPGTPATTIRVSATRERAKTAHSHYPTTGVRVRPPLAAKADVGVPRRDSVGSSARRSVPPSSSGPPQTSHTVPPTPQSHSPQGPPAGGAPFGASQSGPPSASSSGPQPMETNADYGVAFGDPHAMSSASYPSSYSTSPSQPVYAPGPPYGHPPPGYYMGPPPGPVQYPPPLQVPPHFDTSQMGYSGMPQGAHMDTSAGHSQTPTRGGSTPVATHYLPAPSATEGGDGSGHESSDSNAFRVPSQWSADDNSPYSRWNYDGYPQ